MIADRERLKSLGLERFSRYFDDIESQYLNLVYDPIFDRVVDPTLTVRRINVVAGRLTELGTDQKGSRSEQLDLFADPEAEEQARQAREAKMQREHRAQQAVLDIRKRFGGNAILKGMDLKEEATTRDRNEQVGGHKA